MQSTVMPCELLIARDRLNILSQNIHRKSLSNILAEQGYVKGVPLMHGSHGNRSYIGS